MKVLEEEQGNEESREKRLAAATDESEKEEMEKRFGIERAQALNRIQNLSKKQEAELAKLKNKHRRWWFKSKEILYCENCVEKSTCEKFSILRFLKFDEFQFLLKIHIVIT